MEQNEQNNDWLSSQMMQIPIEEFIKMKLAYAELDRKYTNAISRAWEAEENLKEAKAQIRELLGVEEGEGDA